MQQIFSSFFVVMLVIILLSVFIVSVSATMFTWNNNITGVGYRGYDTNFQTYANIGDFDVLATDGKLIFSNANGVVTKTWDIPIYATTGVSNGATKIYVINTTNILVGFNRVQLTLYSSPIYTIVYNLNVNTLGYTTVFSVSQSGVGNPVGGIDLVFITNNIDVFIVYSYFKSITSLPISGTNVFTFIADVYPTAINAGQETNMGNTAIFGSTVVIPNVLDASNNTVYLISANDNLKRYNILLINMIAKTNTLIGSSGSDWSYGGNGGVYDVMTTYFRGSNAHYSSTYNRFVYFIDYTVTNTDNGNQYFDVAISYPLGNRTVSPDQIYFEVIRFNATAILPETQKSISLGYIGDGEIIMPVSFLVPYGVSGVGTLKSGNYFMDFYLPNGTSSKFNFAIISLSGDMPTLDSYGGTTYWQQIVNYYYESSNNYGGFLSSYNTIMFAFDFQNGKLNTALWYAQTPLFTYGFTYVPNTTGFGSSRFSYNYASNLGVQCYVPINEGIYYNGFIIISGLIGGNGSFIVSTTAFSISDSNIYLSGSYSVSTTGNIINGIISFSFIPRSTVGYQGVLINATLGTGGNFLVYHNFHWEQYFGQLDGVTPTPTPPFFDGDGGVVADTPLFSMNLIMILLFFMIIVLPFGIYFGNYGFYFGLIFATILTYMAGFMPTWGLFLLVIGLGLMGYQMFSGMISNNAPQIPQLPHIRKGEK